MPFQSDRLWGMLGEDSDIDSVLWDESLATDNALNWCDDSPQPLFSRLDLDEIIADEMSLVEDGNINDPDHSPGDGADYIEFEDFLKVQMKTGKITSVDDHPNADKLLVIKIEDGPGTTRTVCAGLKGIYDESDLLGLNVVYVANLEPRKLRGVLSEGMILAADDGYGIVRLLTPDGEITPGSTVR